MPEVLAHQQLGAGQERDVEEADLAQASKRVGGRLADHVDRAGRQQGNARLRRERHELDLDLVELELLLGGIDNLEADVDRVTLHLAVRPEVGEGHGGIAMAYRDGLGLGDALHDRTVLSGCKAGDRKDAHGEYSCESPLHLCSSGTMAWISAPRQLGTPCGDWHDRVCSQFPARHCAQTLHGTQSAAMVPIGQYLARLPLRRAYDPAADNLAIMSEGVVFWRSIRLFARMQRITERGEIDTDRPRPGSGGKAFAVRA